VVYGYSGAGHNGRMPCVDLADTVVSIGKSMLKSCIEFIESKNGEWGVRIYKYFYYSILTIIIISFLFFSQ
jgi:DNA polymerase zeta